MKIHCENETSSLCFQKPPHILILEARFYTRVSDLLVDGAKSTLLDHLANIASRVNKPFLEINSSNGHIFDREAMKLWSREYEPGWEPKL